MTQAIRPIRAPAIQLAGDLRKTDGTWVPSFVGTVRNQATQSGTPIDVYNDDVYVFQKRVRITLTGSGPGYFDENNVPVRLRTYAPAPTRDTNHTTGLLPDKNGLGNILYAFGGRMPTLTEGEVYTEPFTLARLDEHLSKGDTRAYVFADDVITLTAAIFWGGRISYEAVVRIKIA